MVALLVVLATGTACSSQDRGADISGLSPEEAQAAAEDAYVFGYPLVMAYKTMYYFAIDSGTSQFKAPFNELRNIPRVFTPEDVAVVSPNSDTPYGILWMDLRAEPMVLCVPEIEKKRYYSIQLADISGFNFGYIGSRTTGNGAGCYLVAGPEWTGDKPNGIGAVATTDADFAVAIYRTQLFNAADLDNVKQIQSQYQVETLSSFLGTTPPDPAPKIDFPVWDEKQALGEDFIGYLNFVLQFTKPAPDEQAIRTRMATIGIGPGTPFDAATLPAGELAANTAGIAAAKVEIKDTTAATVNLLFGTRADYNGDWLARSVAVEGGQWGNDKTEAMYDFYRKDGDGAPLDASKHSYTLTFPKGQLPPVNGFWSVTMYDGTSGLLVENSLNRYLINSPMLPDLKRDADGGLTLYLQNDSPGTDKESNWLPTPNGTFYAVLRIYWPKQEALDGTWKAPPVKGVPE
jgi:hypothetical protein